MKLSTTQILTVVAIVAAVVVYIIIKRRQAAKPTPAVQQLKKAAETFKSGTYSTRFSGPPVIGSILPGTPQQHVILTGGATGTGGGTAPGGTGGGGESSGGSFGAATA
jgi:uncharacterized membrane protein YgcG